MWEDCHYQPLCCLCLSGGWCMQGMFYSGSDVILVPILPLCLLIRRMKPSSGGSPPSLLELLYWCEYMIARPMRPCLLGWRAWLFGCAHAYHFLAFQSFLWVGLFIFIFWCLLGSTFLPNVCWVCWLQGAYGLSGDSTLAINQILYFSRSPYSHDHIWLESQQNKDDNITYDWCHSNQSLKNLDISSILNFFILFYFLLLSVDPRSSIFRVYGWILTLYPQQIFWIYQDFLIFFPNILIDQSMCRSYKSKQRSMLEKWSNEQNVALVVRMVFQGKRLTLAPLGQNAFT